MKILNRIGQMTVKALNSLLLITFQIEWCFIIFGHQCMFSCSLGRDVHKSTFGLLRHSLEHDVSVLYCLSPFSFVHVLLLFLLGLAVKVHETQRYLLCSVK